VRRLTAAVVVAAALALAGAASAAAPNYILVSGKGLPKPIVLGDWNENLRLMSALANAPKAKAAALRGLARRPRFDLAEFWAWSGRPRPTRPSDASQHGTFYPAHRSTPAVFVLMVDGTIAPRLAPATALRILARHGVPVRE
jgi:hypothetical protein